MSAKKGMTMDKAGVVFANNDSFQRYAQEMARETMGNAARISAAPVVWSRGESAFVQRINGRHFGHVHEGLGTKNLIADAMLELTGRCYYRAIAQDCVAMAVNDLCTLGIFPMSTSMHIAVGSSDWFTNDERNRELLEGWRDACTLAGSEWGPGETSTLRGVVEENACELSASTFGAAYGVTPIFDPQEISHGDAMIFLSSSGIHSNGATLIRRLVGDDIDIYNSTLSDGEKFGEALLRPTHIYVPLVEALVNARVEVHYCVNITGHGWRKLMRAHGNFTYTVDALQTEIPVFEMIQRLGSVSREEMYSQFNMGAGFAIYLPESQVNSALDALKPFESLNGINAYRAGYITANESGEKKKVVVKHLGITFESESLQIR